MITYDDFKKVEMKVGQVLSAERIEKSEKLLLLSVDFGEEHPRTVVSGISKYFTPEEITGVTCVFVTNLEARPIMGHESEAMILGVVNGDSFALFNPSSDIPVGSILG